MKIIVQWSETDLAKVRELLNRFGSSNYQQDIRSRNLAHPWVRPSDDAVWDAHVQCMLTSMRRSSLDGPVNRVFGRLGCGESDVSIPQLQTTMNRAEHAQRFLRDNGFRMWQRRGRWIADNFARFMEGGRCLILDRACGELMEARTGTQPSAAEIVAVERRAVYSLCQGRWKVAGLGPKQARHFLKNIGLGVWTIPLDSRLMRFLWERSELPDDSLPSRIRSDR